MSVPPNATLQISPFKVALSDQSLSELKTLLKYAKLPPPTYESSQPNFGVTLKWVQDTKKIWEEEFDWRQHERKINEVPQWTTTIKDDDETEYTLHFVGVFSDKRDAIPLVLLHGWPGSFLEFLPLIPILAASTSPAFHVIVPSLPGYTFSSPPPLHKDFGTHDVARLVNKLLVGLGFGAGYVVQGGDIGSFIARILGATCDGAKLVHLNWCPTRPPEGLDPSALTEIEKAGIARATWFRNEDFAYLLEHGWRPSTIGIVLASNPIALLAWIGEKFLSWTDKTPPVETILENITLWWITETFPRSIYPYREQMFPKPWVHENPELYLHKPLGFSNFPMEIIPAPKSWVATTGNLVFYKHHDQGGHFAALESPQALADDIVEFVRLAWKN